jgi:tetrathionate reductase subunit B
MRRCLRRCEGHGAIMSSAISKIQPASFSQLRQRELPSRQIREDLALNTGVRYAGV